MLTFVNNKATLKGLFFNHFGIVLMEMGLFYRKTS